MTDRRRKAPDQDALAHIVQGEDKASLEGRFINEYKGRGVFTREYIKPKSFVVEYRGVFSQSEGADNKNNKYVFDFMWNGKQYCIDASKDDGTLGRLVNNDHVHPNCKVKIIMGNGRPHLCLFAVREIFPEEEITYKYGDSSLPWRSVVHCEAQCDPKDDKSKMIPEKVASDRTHDSVIGDSSSLEKSKDDSCHHIITCATVNDLNNCADSSGSVSSSQWLGYTCKLCLRTWHKSCIVNISSLDAAPDEHVSKSEISSGSSDDCVPKSCHVSSTDQIEENDPIPAQPCSDDESTCTTNRDNIQTHLAEASKTLSTETSTAQEVSSSTKKNYCFVCKKPQSKIARHFKKHEKAEPAIAEAFLLPKSSKERKRLLEKLRNKGNYEHNQHVMKSKTGSLKVKRRQGPSKISVDTKMYVPCTYCKGMFVRKELWRHTRRCPLKTVSEIEASVESTVLAQANNGASDWTQAISTGVWKVLGKMRQDEIASVVRKDFLILLLAQSLYKKHESDPTKFEYIRTTVREMGRLLLTLREKYSIFSFEDAVKPNNFCKVIGAVKTVAGYDEEKRSYSTPSLAPKLGRSLKKVSDIMLSRASSAQDEISIKAAERFRKLCTKEWAGQVSHTALAALSKSKFNKPSSIPFTEDVQLLHKYLEEKSAGAIENLKGHQSSQAYSELARVTLAQIILFNRWRASEVSKITLESFKKRDQTELQSDVAASQSLFEQKLARHFSRVEIIGKRGRKVAVLLNPDVVHAAMLLVEKRDACNVYKDNPYLFGRPQCPFTSYYRGQDCMKVFAQMCGAKNPENLRSTHLRKHIATFSQILSFKNHELEQLANFLGHNKSLYSDLYRLPEATIEMAKISKLFLAMEKGMLGEFQGKGLDKIEVEDEMDEGEMHNGDDKDDGDVQAVGDDTMQDNDSGGEDGGRDGEGVGDVKDGSSESSDCALRRKGKRKRRLSTQNEAKSCKVVDVPLDENGFLGEEINHLEEETASVALRQRFGIHRFAHSDQDIWFFTRFASYSSFMHFWALIEPALPLMVHVRHAHQRTFPEHNSTSAQSLQPINELFLFLNFLALGSKQHDLADRYGVHQSTVSWIITTWSNFLYTVLGAIRIWIPAEKVKEHMPAEFKPDYADTTVILDCTELRCQCPSSPVLQSEMFSGNKSHCTLKGLIGISPHGAITFISPLYAGSIGDKQIMRESGIISLLRPEMAIMVDRDFLVDELVPCKIYRPPFLFGRSQMSAPEVREKQEIAHLRVHVERCIRRVKEHKIFDSEIPLQLFGNINQLYTVACLLTNYENGPLVKAWTKRPQFK